MDKKEEEILVVDDEESLRAICQDALEDSGYTVYLAKNGQEALDFFQDNKVDLVITDLRMPVLNGLELLKKAKEREIEADFLVMTGFGTIETAVESMKMGAADYLPKPFNISHLLLKVEKVLKARQAGVERKKLNNVVRMLNLGSALNSQLDFQSLINEFLNHLQKNFKPDSMAFFLVSGEEEALTRTAVRGELLKEDPDLFSWSKNICRDVLDEGRSKFLNTMDIKDGESISPAAGKESLALSMMVVPLVNKFKKIGVVMLIRESEEQKYSSAELQLLTVFASHTASSVENARLYGQMQDLTVQVIRSYATAVEAKDIYTRGHSDRVAHYAAQLGRRLGLTSEELNRLHTAGVLHDIGKIGVPDNILNKPSSLSDEEYDVMKKHPVIGQSILSRVESLQSILPIIYHHHERMDGKGYPDGIKGEQIPYLARIISVVDSFEAMTSDRAYRNAMSQDKVIRILEEGAGTQWDSDLVKVWMEIVGKGLVDESGQDIFQKTDLKIIS